MDMHTTADQFGFAMAIACVSLGVVGLLVGIVTLVASRRRPMRNCCFATCGTVLIGSGIIAAVFLVLAAFHVYF